jgi:hypothetical protein
MTKNPLETLSDGVLAIAITLLVIDIRPPEVPQGEQLAHALWMRWSPSTWPTPARRPGRRRRSTAESCC